MLTTPVMCWIVIANDEFLSDQFYCVQVCGVPLNHESKTLLFSVFPSFSDIFHLELQNDHNEITHATLLRQY